MGRTPNHQQGVAALIVTMTLFFAMLLVAVFANRNLVFEQRSSANQYRATQAFEAAEAGLEWAQAHLNSVQRIDADCKASTAVGAISFRARYLTMVDSTSGFSGNVWSNAGVETALQPACVRGSAAWQCSCPANGHPQIVAPSEGLAAPAFTVQFLPGTRPGVVRVVARGCSSLAGVCAPGASTVSDATSRLEVALALLPGLASAPGAALTARSSVNAAGAAMGVHNPDNASGGVAVHAGSGVDVAAAHLTGPAGAPRANLVVDSDASLRALSAEQLFMAYLGQDRAAWVAQPAVTSLTCTDNCAAALEAAITAAGSNALIHVIGDLAIEGPLTLGTPEQPALVVVDGAAQIRGAVTLYGLLYANSVGWNGPGATGALVRGALVSQSTYQGDGTPELIYDASILATLRTRTGTFARVSGSWRDF